MKDVVPKYDAIAERYSAHDYADAERAPRDLDHRLARVDAAERLLPVGGLPICRTTLGASYTWRIFLSASRGRFAGACASPPTDNSA